MSAGSKVEMLKERASYLQKARSFFSDRSILEVDTPLLSRAAPIDEHIDIMSVCTGDSVPGYLHSSPEYAMKRLLSAGMPDIFQLSHVFRKGEKGPLHNPEFTMAEWYRIGMEFEPFIEETVDFVRMFLGPLPFRVLSYQEAFERFAGIDPEAATEEELAACAKRHGLDFSSEASDKDTFLHLLGGFVVEPELGKTELTVLTDYPPSQAALAATEEKNGRFVAKRFEIYFHGIELANGYLELTDPEIQAVRLREANEKRIRSGKESLPIDTRFLEALEAGLPGSCGVAVGFDRLLLLKTGRSDLKEVLPFGWEEV